MGNVDTFLTSVLNKMPSSGKVLRGQSPHAYFAAAALPFRRVSMDALSMLCMRVSRDFTVGRNGIKDAKEGITYWDERLVPMYGERVFLRRDNKSMLRAFVFRADNEEFICKASALQAVDALASTDVSMADLRAAGSRVRRVQKITKELGITVAKPKPSEIIEAMASYAASKNPSDETATQGPDTLVITPMDRVLAAERRAESLGTASVAAAIPARETKKKLAVWAADMEKTGN